MTVAANAQALSEHAHESRWVVADTPFKGAICPDGYFMMGYAEARRVLGNDGIVTGIEKYDDAIVEALATALIKKGSKYDELGSPSALSFFRHSASYYYNKYRKYAPVLEWTHLVETAVRMRNNPEFAHLDPEFTVFAILNHDEGEYFRSIGRNDMVPFRIIHHRWLGDKRHTAYNVRFNDIATDSPKLHGEERILDQLRMAREEMLITGNRENGFGEYHGFYPVFRKEDKTSTYARELWALMNGYLMFKTKAQAETFLAKMHMKGDMLRQLPIDLNHVEEFSRIEQQIEQIVRKKHPSPKRQNFLKLVFSKAGIKTTNHNPSNVLPANDSRPSWVTNFLNFRSFFSRPSL